MERTYVARSVNELQIIRSFLSSAKSRIRGSILSMLTTDTQIKLEELVNTKASNVTSSANVTACLDLSGNSNMWKKRFLDKKLRIQTNLLKRLS